VGRLVLLCVITASLGFIMLRRKWSGRPAFSNEDRDLLFNTPPAAVSTPKLCLRFAMPFLSSAASERSTGLSSLRSRDYIRGVPTALMRGDRQYHYHSSLAFGRLQRLSQASVHR